MDLEVQALQPRRVICEAVKITEENYQQVRTPDRGTISLSSTERREPMLTSDILIGYRHRLRDEAPLVLKEWR